MQANRVAEVKQVLWKIFNACEKKKKETESVQIKYSGGVCV